MDFDLLDDRNQARLARDMDREVLANATSEFGRLVYLASLRDDNTGTYRHYALEKLYPAEHCDEALLRSHRQVFYDWLGFNLAQQRDDLSDYLREVASERDVVLSAWKALEPFRQYLPAGVAAGDQELFLSDLRALVDLLLGEAEACPPAA